MSLAEAKGFERKTSSNKTIQVKLGVKRLWAKVIVVRHQVFPTLLTLVLITNCRMFFVFTLYSLPYAIALPLHYLFSDRAHPYIDGACFFQIHVRALIISKNRRFFVRIFKLAHFKGSFHDCLYKFLRHFVISGIVAMLRIFSILLLIIYVLMNFVHLVYIFDHLFFLLILLFLLLLLMLFKLCSHFLKQFLWSGQYQISAYFFHWFRFLYQLVRLPIFFDQSTNVLQILLDKVLRFGHESKCIFLDKLEVGEGEGPQ